MKHFLLLPLLLCALPAAHAAENTAAEAARLGKLEAQFAPVDISADVSKLADSEKKALTKIIRAAQIMDSLFLRQDWSGNENALLSLLEDRSELGRARLKYFLHMKGPWDRQDANKPFVPGAPPKPAAADFYPADSSKADIEKWIATLGDADKAQAMGFFTVIRKDPAGKYAIVPYSVEYQNELERAAGYLKEAAALTAAPKLKAYLEKRAAAFLSNDYYDSDVAWMELEGSAIEPTIGPYENYEDDWFNYKAAFEAFVGLRDDAETAKLGKFAAELQGLEDRLPIDPKFRNPKLGALAPIRVINQVYAAGDANHGVLTAAYNLPNDEKVTREKGSKRTMLKNVQQAKFKTILTPLAKLALSPADQKNLSFDAFFTHILMHELMHGLGPHDITGEGGKPTTARQALQESFSAFEEAKADISGLWALQQLVDKGVLGKELEKTMYVTFLASTFRTLRFGAAEAHGRGMAMQLNYLLDHGGFLARKDGTFAVDAAKIKPAVEGLTREIMEIQARGDYAGAKAMLEKLGGVRPEAKAVLDRAKDLPIDITARHRTAERLLKSYE